jgi:FkbM family methyltransferase
VNRLISLLRRPAEGHGRAALEARVEKLERALTKARKQEFKDTSIPTVPLDYPGAELVVDASSKLARKRRNATAKEPFTVTWIESLPAGDVLFDIGANVGAYSLIAARRPQGPLKVLAFEPGYANFATLCTNLVLNGAGDEVMPFPVTLGAETRLGSFGYSDVAPGAALHAGGIDADVDAVFTQPVLVFRLDDLVEQFGLPSPNHLKIDVDGAEFPVLQGAEGLLRSEYLRSVMLELSHREDADADDLLSGAGLRRTQQHDRSALDREGTPNPFWYALYER